jgi:serine/threonine protein kinase/formylglycine-generating enzyme required for sulfatase activity
MMPDLDPTEDARDLTLTADGSGVIRRGTGERPELPGRYEDLGLIAGGSFGEVRRVNDTLFERVVAMKILHAEHAERPHVRHRFLVEAQITAQLQHPGIVAVYDRGELSDGRIWYTMKEVRGRTLGAVIDELYAARTADAFVTAASGWTFRRVVDAFARIAQALAYAHSRGIVHRDLKPENLMVGEFGEVLVMDWGLARRIGEVESGRDGGQSSPREPGVTQHGDILGTPSFMPPEQARGDTARHGPWSDVYALGAVLYYLLTGEAPFRGTLAEVLAAILHGPPVRVRDAGVRAPEELCAVCERAMAREIGDRYESAEAMAAEVVAWLDGARRREQALAIVDRVRRVEPVIATLRARRGALEADARRLLEDVKPFEAVERKAPAWALSDEAARLGREIALRETEWLEGMHGALSVEPELLEAHAVLSDHYKDRLLEAERASRGEDAIRFEALLHAHDRGRYASLIRGEGALTLVTDPPGARVSLHAFIEEKRRLVPRFVEELGETPILARRLQKGSYLCVIRAEGRAEVKLPVLIERGGHWDGAAPGESAPHAIPLPREDELSAGEVYVPAGFCWVGGDPQATDSLPGKRIWIDGFVIGKHPVTTAEYLAFLNDLVAAGHEERAEAACPRLPGGNEPALHRDALGAYVLPPEREGLRLRLDLPMGLVSWHGASAYVQWLAEKTGRPWRLPNELEREKAARGADGRLAPWGDHLDATFACVLESHRGAPAPAAVGTYPADESPYGVLGLAGYVRDWCINPWRVDGPPLEAGRLRLDPAQPEDDDFRIIRGGSWASSLQHSRAAARFGARPGTRWHFVGLRATRSFPARAEHGGETVTGRSS